MPRHRGARLSPNISQTQVRWLTDDLGNCAVRENDKCIPKPLRGEERKKKQFSGRLEFVEGNNSNQNNGYNKLRNRNVIKQLLSLINKMQLNEMPRFFN